MTNTIEKALIIVPCLIALNILVNQAICFWIKHNKTIHHKGSSMKVLFLILSFMISVENIQAGTAQREYERRQKEAEELQQRQQTQQAIHTSSVCHIKVPIPVIKTSLTKVKETRAFIKQEYDREVNYFNGETKNILVNANLVETFTPEKKEWITDPTGKSSEISFTSANTLDDSFAIMLSLEEIENLVAKCKNPNNNLKREVSSK